jgi:hypothetical protein
VTQSLQKWPRGSDPEYSGPVQRGYTVIGTPGQVHFRPDPGHLATMTGGRGEAVRLFAILRDGLTPYADTIVRVMYPSGCFTMIAQRFAINWKSAQAKGDHRGLNRRFANARGESGPKSRSSGPKPSQGGPKPSKEHPKAPKSGPKSVAQNVLGRTKRGIPL